MTWWLHQSLSLWIRLKDDKKFFLIRAIIILIDTYKILVTLSTFDKLYEDLDTRIFVNNDQINFKIFLTSTFSKYFPHLFKNQNFYKLFKLRNIFCFCMQLLSHNGQTQGLLKKKTIYLITTDLFTIS